MTDPHDSFEALCPLLVQHASLGKVMWNPRSAAFVAFKKMLGDRENVPLLIYPPHPAASAVPDVDHSALFRRAEERLSSLEGQAHALRECGLAAWRDRIASESEDRYRFSEPDRPTLTLGSISLLENEAIVTWFFGAARWGEHASIWVDASGRLRTVSKGSHSSAPAPVPDWVLALPARVQYPVIGELVQTLNMTQYLAYRPAKTPPLVRVDVRAMDPAALPELLDRTAAVLARVVSTLDESTGHAESMLEEWRRERGRPRFRWEIEWAVFLEEDSVALLFRDMMPPKESMDECFSNVALHFDSTGTITEVEATTEEETYRVAVPPPAPPAERVIHANFGRGTVVAELEGGKVRVRFDAGSERVLQRTFLKGGGRSRSSRVMPGALAT